jgi:transcriptional regulator with XRE-family HTH domain
MTQEELAYEAGIDRAYLSELERGKVGISLERANALATALHCRLSDLLKGD